MGIFDSQEVQDRQPVAAAKVHPALYAADNHNIVGEGTSISMGDVADFFTKGTQVSALSGLQSIWNTGVDVANFFGAGVERVSTQASLESYDSDLAQYYQKHEQGADLAGFLGTSLIPGIAGLKAYNALKVVKNTGTIGRNFGEILGAPASWQSRYKLLAAEELAAGEAGGTLFGVINRNKLVSITAGFADQALQAAAFETAVAATMQASPLLDQMSFTDNVWNITKGALLGGVIGGGIEALVLNRNLRGLIADVGKRRNELSGVTDYGRLNAATGDLVTEELRSLDLLATPFPASLPNATEDMLRVAAKELEVRNKAIEGKWLRVTNLMTDSAKGDAEVGNALSAALRRMWEGRTADIAAGGVNKAFANSWDDVLLLAKSFDRIGLDAAINPSDIYYVQGSLKDVQRGVSPFSINRPLDAAGKFRTDLPGYILNKGSNELKLGAYGAKEGKGAEEASMLYYANSKEAFADGVDVFFNQQLGPMVSPFSKKVTQVNKPTFLQDLIWDTREGVFRQEAIATVGDIARGKENVTLIRSKEGYYSGLSVDGKFYSMEGVLRETGVAGKMARVAIDFSTITPIEANARYVYASLLANKDIKLLVRRPIASNDIPFLEAASNAFKTGNAEVRQQLAKLEIRSSNGSLEKLNPSDLEGFVLARKREEAMRLMNSGKSTQEIAAIVNTRTSWVEGGMAGEKGAAIALEENLLPRNIKISYDINDPVVMTKDGFPALFPGASWVAKGMDDVATRIKIAQDTAVNVSDSIVLGEIDQFPADFSSALVKEQANALGAGATFVGAANANYGSIGQVAQTIGKGTKLLVDRLTKATLDALTPTDAAIRANARSAAELGVVTSLLRRSEQKYYFHPDGSNVLITKDLRDWLVSGNKEAAFKPSENWLMEFVPGSSAATGKVQQYVKHALSDDVANFFRTSTERNSIRVKHTNSAREAWGMHSRWDAEAIYVPPIKVNDYPFLAFVKEREGMGGTMGDAGVITAGSEAQLAKLIDQVPKDRFTVHTNKDTKEWKQAKGDYEYALSVHENEVNSMLQKKGIMGEFFPKTNAEAVLGEYIQWHTQMETKLARTAVELRYGQQIAEIRALGNQATNIAASKVQGTSAAALAKVPNPYEDYIKSMMNISRKSETPYALWSSINEFAEAGFSKAFNTATDAFNRAAKGKITFEEANEETAKFGLGAPFQNAATQLLANIQAPKPVLTALVGKMNSALSAVTLRLDTINALINTISTPILLSTEIASIKNNLKNPELVGKLGELLSTKIPGREESLLSPTKLMATAIFNYFGKDFKALLKRYTDAGYIRGVAQQHHDILDAASSIGLYMKDGKLDKLDKAAGQLVEKASSFTGNNFAEEFTRFISADVMRQITEAAGLGVKEANGYINTFVNRVQGNYIAAQRPILFQGPMGQALGLFQTYQFNLLQQVFRHVENGDKKTLAIFAGLQSGLYGMQGLPAFNFINTHIIGNAEGNPLHKDIHSGVRSIVGKDIGDFILHGLASNALTLPVGIYNQLTDSKVNAPNLALYSRGDINPRSITIIPNPLNPSEIPAVSATIKVLGNILDMGKRVGDGGKLSAVITQGLEHNGVSRPLTGLAQVMQGYSTTSKGGLISAPGAGADNLGFSNDLWAISQAGRILGAKPLQESISLDHVYRTNAYRAKDAASINQLGEAVKTTFVAGGTPSAEAVQGFAESYAASGGNQQSFNRFLLNASKQANTSVVNQVYQHMQNPRAQSMMDVMGGLRLPDFSNSNSVLPSEGEPQ